MVATVEQLERAGGPDLFTGFDPADRPEEIYERPADDRWLEPGLREPLGDPEPVPGPLFRWQMLAEYAARVLARLGVFAAGDAPVKPDPEDDGEDWRPAGEPVVLSPADEAERDRRREKFAAGGHVLATRFRAGGEG